MNSKAKMIIKVTFILLSLMVVASFPTRSKRDGRELTMEAPGLTRNYLSRFLRSLAVCQLQRFISKTRNQSERGGNLPPIMQTILDITAS